MSDLTAFRNHARAMSTAEHKPECLIDCQDWRGIRSFKMPRHGCPGCVTDAERALWARLADEADAYLHRHEEEGLFA